MYFPIHNVPEAFDKFAKFATEFIDVYNEGFIPECIDVGNYIYNHYITDGTDNYIPEFLCIHESLIVENGPVWS